MTFSFKVRPLLAVELPVKTVFGFPVILGIVILGSLFVFSNGWFAWGIKTNWVLVYSKE